MVILVWVLVLLLLLCFLHSIHDFRLNYEKGMHQLGYQREVVRLTNFNREDGDIFREVLVWRKRT